MLDTSFMAPDRQLIGANELGIGDTVLDAAGNPVQVVWKEVHPKTPRGIVELKTKSTKLVVTESHRVPVPWEHDAVVKASMLRKGDEDHRQTKKEPRKTPSKALENHKKTRRELSVNPESSQNVKRTIGRP